VEERKGFLDSATSSIYNSDLLFKVSLSWPTTLALLLHRAPDSGLWVQPLSGGHASYPRPSGLSSPLEIRGCLTVMGDSGHKDFVKKPQVRPGGTKGSFRLKSGDDIGRSPLAVTYFQASSACFSP
jgi:hypothetical protein